MTLSKIYHQRVQSGALNKDSVQLATLELFETLMLDLRGGAAINGSKIKRVFRGKAKKQAKGIYLFGGVGRGKSMLMDLFFEAAPVANKRRVHFHAFMQEIHEGMHRARRGGVSDALEPVAQAVVKQADLLCFDEMQISDITDAMIVGRLFEKLFAAGVTVVTTSNRAPQDLYKDGLNRDLFLPFIGLIKERLQVCNLDSETDHRQNRLLAHKTYFTPIDEAAEMAIQRVWSDLVGKPPKPLELSYKARKIVLPAYHSGVALATFRDLCGQPLGPADYLEIARNIRVLILKDIPRLTRAQNNEAKRFVTLIDAMYEAKVRLIASAATQPEKLYEAGPGAFEFVRTASRMREMQSADWVGEAR